MKPSAANGETVGVNLDHPLPQGSGLIEAPAVLWPPRPWPSIRSLRGAASLKPPVRLKSGALRSVHPLPQGSGLIEAAESYSCNTLHRGAIRSLRGAASLKRPQDGVGRDVVGPPSAPSGERPH